MCYCIVGIFSSGQSFIFFPFCNEQERKLDARFLSKTNVVYQLYGKNGIKTDEILSFSNKRNFGPTKYNTRSTVFGTRMLDVC